MEAKVMKRRVENTARELLKEAHNSPNCNHGKGYAEGIRRAIYEFRKAVDKRRG